MKNKSLELLNYIIGNNAARQIRSLDLLKQPDDNSDGWFMCVPPCFNESLDIKQTERVSNKKKSLYWTQGTFFSFKAGDTIYDTPKAYEQWSEALKHINICLTVKDAVSAGISEDDKIRSAGSVAYEILKPNKQRTKLILTERKVMTQDDFIRYLIAGG